MRRGVYERDGVQEAIMTMMKMKTKPQHRTRSAQASSLAKLFSSSPSLFLRLISCCSALLPCLGFSPVNQPCSQNSSSLSSFRLSLSGRLRMLPIE